jgi:hypothetical protein
MGEVGKCVICIAEDRRSEQVAIKLLLLSLSRHCPDLDVVLTYPSADEEFRAWAAGLPRVVVRVEGVSGASGWNVKPHALLPLLAAGYDEVWWIDSDVILARDFRAVLPPATKDAFVVCQEALYGAGGHRDEGARAGAWGFDVGRVLPSTLNSCVIRVTRAHVPLLERWKELLESDEYVRAQSRPWFERPNHMVGDQDVLTALLSSREFASIPVVILRRGREIVQYFGPPGYTTSERLINLVVGLPPFVHEQGGGKPWHLAQARRARGLRPAVDRLYSELSPYRHCARTYRDELVEDFDDTTWLDHTSPAGRALWALGLGRAPLIGLPLALVYSVWRPVRLTGQALKRQLVEPDA